MPFVYLCNHSFQFSIINFQLDLVRILACGTAIDTLRTQLNEVERPVAETVLKHLAAAQVVVLILVQITSIQDTTQVPVIGAKRCRCTGTCLIAIHTLHITVVT